MSIVVCRIYKKHYEIAADSITVRGHTQSKGNQFYFSKLSEVNGMVIGGVGLCEEAALFFLFASTRKPTSPTVESILRFMGDFSEWKRKMIDKASIENDYLIGYADHVFEVEGWFVCEVKTFQAIGAGKDFALAALHLGHDAKSAVGVATELSVYCEKPINIITKKISHHNKRNPMTDTEAQEPSKEPTERDIYLWRHNRIAHFMDSAFKRMMEMEKIEWEKLRPIEQQRIAKHMNKLIPSFAVLSNKLPELPAPVERKEEPVKSEPEGVNPS